MKEIIVLISLFSILDGIGALAQSLRNSRDNNQITHGIQADSYLQNLGKASVTSVIFQGSGINASTLAGIEEIVISAADQYNLSGNTTYNVSKEISIETGKIYQNYWSVYTSVNGTGDLSFTGFNDRILKLLVENNNQSYYICIWYSAFTFSNPPGFSDESFLNFGTQNLGAFLVSTNQVGPGISYSMQNALTKIILNYSSQYNLKSLNNTCTNCALVSLAINTNIQNSYLPFWTTVIVQVNNGGAYLPYIDGYFMSIVIASNGHNYLVLVSKSSY